MNNAETNATVQQTSVPSSASGTTTQLKPSAIVFSSNNGVIDDPLIQSLAAEQAASAHNYDLLSYRHKRVRRPLRYGDQSTRPSNIQLLLGLQRFIYFFEAFFCFRRTCFQMQI